MATTTTNTDTATTLSTPEGLEDWYRQYIYDPKTGPNWAGIGAGIYGLYGLMGGNDAKGAGWNIPPPKIDVSRHQVPVDSTNRRPGQAGRRYFSDVIYTPEGDAGLLAQARADVQTHANNIAATQPKYLPQGNPYVGAFKTPWEAAVPTGGGTSGGGGSSTVVVGGQSAPPVPTPAQLNPDGTVAMAEGGQVPTFQGPLQSGGFVVPGDVVRHADPAGAADKERGLAALHRTLGAQAIRGPGDAMSDSIPTTIDGEKPAAVANGEAYVPPQEVKRMGGADRLYEMMDKLRLERTGSRKQINPDNPHELQKAYQQGGGIARFNTGGVTSGTSGTSGGTPTPSVTGTTPATLGNSTVNTLSPYIGEYVTTALGKGAAMANAPYQAYTGPLTAGASDLQQMSFAGATQLAATGFTPEKYQFTPGQFSGETAQQYMNPYVSAALNPQLAEMKRQADIARLDDAARLTKAGAYGGSRQAIMESEGRRNLLDKQSEALGTGYMNAYDRALQQYNAEQKQRLDTQGMNEASRKYSAEFGLKSLQNLAELGGVQRSIEAEGIAADKAQFEEERQYAYAQPAYQLGLLSGIPIGGSTTTPNTSGISSINNAVGDISSLYKTLSDLF